VETKYGWHYCTYDTFVKILHSGLLKSRALLISEALRQRPDWESIKLNPEAALPEYMKRKFSFLRHPPVLWFSRRQKWESQAGIYNETKDGNWSDNLDRSGARSMEETFVSGGGLIRLGLREHKLLGWHDLMDAIKSPLLWRMLLHLSGCNGDEKFVMGRVGAALPLQEIDRIDTFVVTSAGGAWVPFLYPSSMGRTISTREGLEALQVAYEEIPAEK
jgi:hypothetical protein